MLSLTARAFLNASTRRVRSRFNLLSKVGLSTSAITNNWVIETVSNDATKLVNRLHCIWAPFVVSEEFAEDKDRTLFECEDLTSSIENINMSEVADLVAAGIIKSGTNQKVIEIDPQVLDEFTLRSIGYACHYHKLAPWLNMELRPNSLLIDSAGDFTITHANNADDFIGTLVVNLNSDYVGGEMKVSYRDRTIELNQKKEWTAMHKSCTYHIGPILSGHRVDMIFDIYSFDTYAAFDAFNYGTIDPMYCLDIDQSKQEAIVRALHRELEEHHAVVISLAGDYVPNNTSESAQNSAQSGLGSSTIHPEVLANGDAKLHALLATHFNVTLHPIEVHCNVDSDTDRLTVTHAGYRNTFSVMSNNEDAQVTKLVLSNRFHPSNLVSTIVSEDGETSLIYHNLALTVCPK